MILWVFEGTMQRSSLGVLKPLSMSSATFVYPNQHLFLYKKYFENLYNYQHLTFNSSLECCRVHWQIYEFVLLLVRHFCIVDGSVASCKLFFVGWVLLFPFHISFAVGFSFQSSRRPSLFKTLFFLRDPRLCVRVSTSVRVHGLAVFIYTSHSAIRLVLRCYHPGLLVECMKYKCIT